MAADPNPALIGRYHREGFLHVPAVLTAAEVEVLGAAVDEAVVRRTTKDTRALTEKTPYEQSFIQCQYVWEDFPSVRPLTFHPRIGAWAAALLGAPRIRLWHDQALYKEAGGRDTEMHQDHPYWPIVERRTLTVWIPLIDVDERTGCMGYVPGSQVGEAEYVDIFKTPGAGETLAARFAARPAVFVPARAGDAIFHDGSTAHLARPNRSNATRRVYTAIYFADGSTRSPGQAHPSVDRDAIAVGAVINGAATPIAWPLPEGQFPIPAPWPRSTDAWGGRAATIGSIPE